MNPCKGQMLCYSYQMKRAEETKWRMKATLCSSSETICCSSFNGCWYRGCHLDGCCLTTKGGNGWVNTTNQQTKYKRQERVFVEQGCELWQWMYALKKHSENNTLNNYQDSISRLVAEQGNCKSERLTLLHMVKEAPNYFLIMINCHVVVIIILLYWKAE